MSERLIRQWQIVMLLSEHRLGLRSKQIAERLEISRPTVDRELAVIREAGVQLTSETRNGEKWHRFVSKPLPPLQPTVLQLAALQLARTSLGPLEGTRLVREIDALLCGKRIPPTHLRLKTGTPTADIVRTIDKAIEHQRRVRLTYTAASRKGETRQYEVDPIQLKLIDQALYLGAYDRASTEARRFKILRIREATFLDEKADLHPDLEERTLFGRAVKVWSGEPQQVVVVLKSDVAWLASEYPLISDQRVETQPDGSVQITAQVAGLVEAKQWVLGWGAAAQALSPPELRTAVMEELSAALQEYQGPGPKPVRLSPKARPSLVSTRGPTALRLGGSQEKSDAPANGSAQRR